MSKAQVNQVAVAAIKVAASKPVADERASAEVRELSTEELKSVGGASEMVPFSTTVKSGGH